MKQTELKKIVRGIQRIPIRLKKLYWGREYRNSGRPIEASRKEHSSWCRGRLGKRFYGQALCDKKQIELDLETCFRYQGMPLSFVCEVLVHEVCHLVFRSSHVSKIVDKALKRRMVWAAAERRLMKIFIGKI